MIEKLPENWPGLPINTVDAKAAKINELVDMVNKLKPGIGSEIGRCIRCNGEVVKYQYWGGDKQTRCYVCFGCCSVWPAVREYSDD